MEIRNKRQLYNNIMKNISNIVKQKLNEDLLSDLEVDNDDDSEFINYDKNIVISFEDKPDSMYMNNYYKPCSLLCVNNNFFNIIYIKNLKSYNDIKEHYGKVIAINVGKGLWLSTEFNNESNDRGQWSAKENFIAYSKFDSIYYNTDKLSEITGWKLQQYILNKYKDYIWQDGKVGSKPKNDSYEQTVIWGQLYNTEVTGLGKNHLYLPNMDQVEKIFNNIHNKGNNLRFLIRLYDMEYMTSNFIDFHQFICFSNFDGEIKFLQNYGNSMEMMCFALIHFD